MRHPFKPSASRSKAKRQLRKASLDPVRLDELLGQLSVNEVQDEARKAQRAERHAALQEADRMRRQERNDAVALHPEGADQ